jgi:hypothetical protein
LTGEACHAIFYVNEGYEVPFVFMQILPFT